MMDINKQTLIKRVSVRKYKKEPLSVLTLLEIEDMIQAQKPLFNTKYQIDVVSDGATFQNLLGGIIGSYGKIRAPHYIVASTELQDECFENMGYMLEYMVLKLTEKNIASCWIGGGIKKNLFKDYLKLDEELTPIAVIALGNPEQDDVFRKDIQEFHRKPLEELVTGQLTDAYRNIMKLIQIAPSSVNSQPWRFHLIKKDQLQVYRIKNNFIMKPFMDDMNRIDIGIACCHLELGAKWMGKSLEFIDEKIENKQLIYFKTIKLV